MANRNPLVVLTVRVRASLKARVLKLARKRAVGARPDTSGVVEAALTAGLPSVERGRK